MEYRHNMTSHDTVYAFLLQTDDILYLNCCKTTKYAI